MTDGLVTIIFLHKFRCASLKWKLFWVKKWPLFPTTSHQWDNVFFCFLLYMCFYLFIYLFFSREQLLRFDLRSDRNLAGPPGGCFSVETEIQTATYRDVMLVVYKHTMLEQERWRLLSPRSFRGFVAGFERARNSFFPLLHPFNVITPTRSCTGVWAWGRGLSSDFFSPVLSQFSFLVLCISCPLLLLPSPVLCLFQSRFISLPCNYFIPALLGLCTSALVCC